MIPFRKKKRDIFKPLEVIRIEGGPHINSIMVFNAVTNEAIMGVESLEIKINRYSNEATITVDDRTGLQVTDHGLPVEFKSFRAPVEEKELDPNLCASCGVNFILPIMKDGR